MKSLAVARLKRVRAVELLAAGSSYEEIARQVGFTNRGSAHRAVSKALAEREVESVDDYRQLELARLDQLQVAVWDDAVSGDLKAIYVVLRLMDKRDRLLGLDKPVSPAAPHGILLSDWV